MGRTEAASLGASVPEAERGPECESLTERGIGSVSNNRNNKNLSEHFHILKMFPSGQKLASHEALVSPSIVQLKISPDT